MDPTRRYWGIATLVAVLAVSGAALGHTLPLFGAAALGGWLLAQQYRYLHALRDAEDALELDVSVTPVQVPTDSPATVAVVARLDEPSSLALALEPHLPAALRVDGDDRFSLTAGETRAERAVTVTAPVAGTFDIGPVSVRASDPAGLFVETVDRGPTVRFRSVPRRPRDVHVGRGGESVTQGEHAAGERGSGIEVTGLREYVSGDALDRIDWRATARLNEPHVREHESETERRTVLVVDHGSSMAVGPPGETKLDYAREVALTYLDSTRAVSDPVGLYTVGDDGLSSRRDPEATPQGYRALVRRLEDITADGPFEAVATDTNTTTSPTGAHRAAETLAGEETAFATTLQPYFDASGHIERAEGDPLVGVARMLRRLRGTTWTVLVTDDADQTAVREAVELARRGEGQVVVFLTPTVLFEPGGLGDVERAYERYRAFEEFRRDLEALDRVTALEIAPGDRIAVVLEAGPTRSTA